jgi:hypothetical protein
VVLGPRFLIEAGFIIAVAVVAAAGPVNFHAYPGLRLGPVGEAVGLAAALLAAGLLPFADRRGIVR